MIALEPAIAQQLRTALPAGWTIKGASEEGDRKARPIASVALAGCVVADPSKSAAVVASTWLITLVVIKGPDAASALDEALTAAVAGLHGWAPGQVAGRYWGRLLLQQVTPPDVPAEDGLLAFSLAFETAARYDGCPDSF